MHNINKYWTNKIEVPVCYKLVHTLYTIIKIQVMAVNFLYHIRIYREKVYIFRHENNSINFTFNLCTTGLHDACDIFIWNKYSKQHIKM